MELFMKRVPLAASEDDLKVGLAKILHRPPFPLHPPLNFDVTLFKKYDTRGKIGILTLPSESLGQTFLRAYGTSGVIIKGVTVTFSPSNKPLNEEKVAILLSKEWRDPQRLQAEQEQRIREGRPYDLRSYAFGRFLNDGSFSSEFVADGPSDIACDLERRQIRFILHKQGRQPFEDEDDFTVSMLNLTLQTSTTTIVSYSPKLVHSIVESGVATQPILFIRAEAFPVFATETHSALFNRTDTGRAQGLVPDVPMPPGCFNLMCTFMNEDEKDAFVRASRSRFHIRHITRQSAIQVRDNTLTHHDTAPMLDFLKDLPFELAFEVEKAVLNWTLGPRDARSLANKLRDICDTYGEAAAQIFRRFIVLLEENEQSRQPMRKRRRRQRATRPTLEGRLEDAVVLYLEEQSRPKARLAPALSGPGISQTYHMILTPTRHILEGPVADQSNSVLRRFQRNECFLRVSFQDENRSKLRREMETSISDLLEKRYEPVLLNGCSVAGRKYDLLGYSMSGLKEHSLWFVTPFRDDEGRLLDARVIRESLGDFSRLMYQPARLGARWSQAFSATDPSITLEPGEIVKIDDIKSRTTGKVMTDGCSPISTELARAIWRANQRTKNCPARGTVPSAYQFRLGGAKGMVVQDPTLEGRVICLRPSQIKFDAPDRRTFDIQSTSARPKVMFLNRPLIVLLEYLGSSCDRIIELQDRSISEAASVRSTFSDASKVLQQHGLGTSFHLPSLFRNMSSMLNVKMRTENEAEGRLYNDLVENTLHCAETHILRELKYRAHIAIPGSYTLLGVSDEWDCLAEGEIFATVHDEKKREYQEITGTVAITRSPQIHPGDVKIVTAVRKKELEHLKNVVVFSCMGDRPLSSCLGGGDLDGDDFNLILDPDLIPEKDEQPGDYISLPIKQTTQPCGIKDVVKFIFDYIESDLVGHIAISHLRFSDLADPSCANCLKLAEFASQAVDFPKTGTAVNFVDLPKHRDRTKPDFLAREGADADSERDNFYNSEKLLGKLYRRVPLKDWMPREWNQTSTPSGGEVIEKALRQVDLYVLGLSLAAPSAELYNEMEFLLDDYCEQLFAIAQTHTLSKHKDIHLSESELVSGTIMANWSDHHRRREAVNAMNLQTHELVRAVRAEMRANPTTQQEEDDLFDDETLYDDENDYYRETRQVAEMFKRAWAAWCTAESVLMYEPATFGPQSFGLIALGRMLELIKAARDLAY